MSSAPSTERTAGLGDHADALTSVIDTVLAPGAAEVDRKEPGVERRFRDAPAARVMAPTTDALNDFVARACPGRPLLDGRLDGRLDGEDA